MDAVVSSDDHMLPAHFLPEGCKNFEWTTSDSRSSGDAFNRLNGSSPEEYVPDATLLDNSGSANSTITYTEAGLNAITDVEHNILHDFLKAAETGDLQRLEVLLERGSSLINAKDKDGYTATHRACYSGHEHVLAYLIKQGCNICARTNDGWEPIHCAVRWNHVQVCKLLIKKGANVNAKTNGFQTPLHLAAVSPTQVAILEMLLLRSEIDANIVNGAGDTAEDLARRSGPHVKLFQMIDKSLTI